jgi:glycosyltransferase involved in cell wall biosynthesis
VLSIGIPSVIKGHDLVIRALARIPQASRPALRLVMPWLRGSEPLERLAKANGVELIVEAAIEEADMLDRYRRALATVCAARLEAFGFTPLESMACGTPVVAIQEGGYRETVVDGLTGFLVEPDPDAIAAAIAALASDPSLVAKLGLSGREHVVRSWQWDKGGQALDSLLRKVATSREPASERPVAHPAG